MTRSDAAFNATVLGLFLFFSVFGALHHGMWRDEVQAFLIARESGSLSDLIHNLRYDGHPILWYLLIWPSARLFGDPDAMKPVSIAVSTIGVGTFLWCGPWTRLEKVLWPFGYHVLFEYTIRSRSYGVGMALTMLLCAVWRLRDRRIVLVGVLLGLMANVHLYFGVLAAAAACSLLTERIARSGLRATLAIPWQDWVAALIFTGMSLFAAFVAAPPTQGDWAGPPEISWTVLLHAMVRLIAAPLYQLELPPEVILPALVAAAAAGASVVALTLWSTRTSLAAMMFLGLCVVVLFVMFSCVYPPGAQHVGVLLLAITATHWFLRTDQGQWHGTPGWPRRLFHAMLLCQAVSGLGMVGYYTTHPHAHGRTVAAFIRDHGWADQPVAGFGDSLSPVCGYLRAPACYYIERNRWSAQTIYDAIKGQTPEAKTITRATYDTLIARAAALGPAVTLVVPDRWPDWPDIMAAHGLHKVASYRDATADNYEVYRKAP